MKRLALFRRGAENRQRHGKMPRLDGVGHGEDDVVIGRRTVGPDISRQRHDAMLGAFHRRHLVDGSLQRAARSDRQDDRLLPLQPALDLRGAGLGNADSAGGAHGIARDDLHLTKAELALERLAPLQAGGDRMVEADLDQAFCHGERDEPLRRLPGNPHGCRDFVLGAARDVVEPTRPRRVIQPPVHIGPSRH